MEEMVCGLVRIAFFDVLFFVELLLIPDLDEDGGDLDQRGKEVLFRDLVVMV